MIRLVLLALLTLSACKSNRQVEVEGIWVPQADGLVDAPQGTTVAVTRGVEIATIPEGKDIRLAIARDVLWSQVRALRKRILEAGNTPHLMVASDRKVGAIELYDELQSEEVIEIFVSVGGKLCVSPPGTPEAKCVQGAGKTHVDRAHTRELTREAVKAYGLHDIVVHVPPDLEWADLVRSVDGARTAFQILGIDETVRVRLK